MKSPKAKAFDFALMAFCVCASQAYQPRQDQRRFDRCAAEFISFDKRQKKQNQRKTLCANSTPGHSLMKGFFYGTSCPIEKRRTSMCGALRVCKLQHRRPDLQEPRQRQKACR